MRTLARNAVGEPTRRCHTQDVILGADLPAFLAILRTRPLALIVLAPSSEAVTRRESSRTKSAYTAFTPQAMDATMRESTEELGFGWTPLRGHRAGLPWGVIGARSA